jgi:hypothetical protein
MSTLAGEPATELIEDEAEIEMASGVRKIVQPGATGAAKKIGELLLDAASAGAVGASVADYAASEDLPRSIEIPPGFKPWEIRFGENAPELAPDQHQGNATRLRRNMHKAGWDCPKGFATHHIANKGDPPKSNNPDYKALRDCLAKWRVDIDSAGNGVCLPNSAEAVAKDPAARHRGREGDIHGADITAYMLGICKGVKSAKELQNHLDSWRKLLAQGKVPSETLPLEH